jgi:hypothetical protein
MSTPVNSPLATEKTQLRDQITEQIREYLQRGGQIEVVQDQRDSKAALVGSIWSDVDDDLDVSS